MAQSPATCTKTSLQFFACGARRVINGVEKVFKDILKLEISSANSDELDAEFDRFRAERFAIEVFN